MPIRSKELSDEVLQYAQVLAKLGRLDQAREALHGKTMPRHILSPPHKAVRAELQWRAGEPWEALETLEEEWELHDEDVHLVHTLRGTILTAVSRYQDGRQQYELALAAIGQLEESQLSARYRARVMLLNGLNCISAGMPRAMATLRKAIDECELCFPEGNSLLGAALLIKAEDIRKKKKGKGAFTISRALKMIEACVGPDDPDALHAKAKLQEYS